MNTSFVLVLKSKRCVDVCKQITGVKVKKNPEPELFSRGGGGGGGG